MAHSKNNSWLLPSFDYTPISKTISAKHSASILLANESKRIQRHSNISQRQSNTSSLSSLLAACEPKKAFELVVSRQKQTEILNWLQNGTPKGHPSILLLSGTSGCGKTEAIKLLAEENGFTVIEWVTPVDQVPDENNWVMRQGDRFEDFLFRVTRYNSVYGEASRRLLLIKDIPNVFFMDHNSLYSVLEKYKELGKDPIVFVSTETANSQISQTLFSPNIREKFNIQVITINPVTQTAMKNALKRVSQILNARAHHILHVSDKQINEVLSENVGDIRSALLNLIFISLTVPGTQMTTECGSREQSLTLLHGIGRVINPKREVNGDSWKFVHDPDEIASFFQSQATVFLHFLQENYLNTLRGIEEADTCADILSLADTLSIEWRDFNLTKLVISFYIRGIMITNEKPVHGWNPVIKPRSRLIKEQRNLARAETQWYESKIKPHLKNNKDQCNVDIEEDIE